MTRLHNIVALGLALIGLANASPIVTEEHELARRTTQLQCGFAKHKGVDLGCLCDLPGLRLDLDIEFGGFPVLDLFLGSKQYPPGCRPTCDDKVYDCPHGWDGKKCKEPVKCPPNHCESYGKCCPYGTQNTDGICCPKNCVNLHGKCHIPTPEPPKEPECHKEHEELNKWTHSCQCVEHYEYVGEHCVMKCPGDQMRDKKTGSCVCINEHFKPDHEMVCRPQCSPDEVLNKHENVCIKCPYGVEHGKCKPKPPPQCTHEEVLDEAKMVCIKCPYGVEHGKCKPKPPPQCHDPMVLSKDKMSCVCKAGTEPDHHGGCKPIQQGCGGGMKWCKTKCCRYDQEEKDNGVCGCPTGTKQGLLGLCTKIGILGINL